MPRAFSLRGALDRTKGVDYELQRQKKLRKSAEKKNVAKAAAAEPATGVEKSEKTESKAAAGQTAAETAGSGESDIDIDPSRLVNSDSDSDSDWEDDEPPALVPSKAAGSPDADSDSDSNPDEADEDVPLSDLDSLPDEDRQDLIPHQRLTINNTAALSAALARFALPYGSDADGTAALPFAAHQAVTAKTSTANAVPDADDDLAREAAFEAQALAAAVEGRRRLKAAGVPFARPVDFFAEMVKTDAHMGSVKAQLVKEASAKKASAEARRLRDLKKFGKKVQVEKEQERARDRRALNEKVESLKKRRQGAQITNETEADMFDVELEAETSRPGGSGGRKRSRDAGAGAGAGAAGASANPKRQRKNEKFGFGGKKKHNKSGDAKSSADMSGFSAKRMKKSAGAGGGASKRPGKARRAKGRA